MKRKLCILSQCKLFVIGFIFFVAGFALAMPSSTVHAANYTQTINLTPGWNLVSTPRVLDSHAFSSAESDYSIYVLNPTTPSGWSTVADLGQTEFTPLYGYFVKNNTTSNQTLTFNYAQSLDPNQRLFTRTFPATGWYSVGFANPGYLTAKCLSNNQNSNAQAVQSLNNNYDYMVDMSPLASSAVDSLNIDGNWATKTPQDIGSLKNFSELKGYAIYINHANASLTGTQNIDPVTDCAQVPLPPSTGLHAMGTNIIDSTGTIYMISPDGTRRAYSSPQAFLSYGFNSYNQIISASAEDLALPAGALIPPRDGSIVCPSTPQDNGSCYLMTNGQAAAFSPGLITALGFNLSRATVTDISLLSTTTPINNATSAHRPGVLINNNDTVEFIGLTGAYGIPDMATFNSWGFSLDDIVPANASDQTLIQTGVITGRAPGQLNPVIISNLATVRMTGDSVIGAGSVVQAGTSNVVLWSVPVTVSQRNASFKGISFKQIGTIPADSIQNLKLYVDGAQAGATTSITSDNAVSFNLINTPITLTTGSHTIELHGDIVSGASYTFNFTLQQANDAIFYDTSYNVSVPFTNSNGFPVSNLAPFLTTISPGTALVQQDPSFTATQFLANQPQVTLGQWTMKAFGEDIKVQRLQVILNYSGIPLANEGFKNLAIYVNGNMIEFPRNAFGDGTHTSYTYDFGTTALFTIQAGQTIAIEVKGDSILNGATNAASVRADLSIPAYSLQGVTSYNYFPYTGTTYTGTALTAGCSTALLAANTAYPNQSLSVNTIKQKIGSYVIQAGSADGVKVTQLMVGISGTMPLTSLSNLYLVTPDMPNGTAPVNPNSSNTFAVNFTVPANNTAQVDVYADLGIAPSGAQTVTTTMIGTGTGTSSNQAVLISNGGGSPATGQTITVGTGSLSSAALDTSASPVSQFVIGGSTNQPVATYTFIASPFGGVTVQELGFTDASGAVTSVTVGGRTTPMIVGKALVTGLNLAVPTGYAGLDVPVTANYTPVGLNGIADTASQLTLAHIKYLAGSRTVSDGLATFGDATNNLVGATGIPANSMFVAGTAPTITLAPTGSSLAVGYNLPGKLTIIANAAGNMKLNSIPLIFSSSHGITLGTTSAVTIIDHESGQVVGTGNLDVNGTGTITLTNQDYSSISAGSSRTYDVRVMVYSLQGMGQALSVGLGDPINFVFHDVNGNADLTGRVNSVLYIPNYPANQVSIHN